MAQYFYDNQIRRFLLQFSKIFSGWYVTQGKDPNGNNILVRVPIQYGDSSRQASTIIANNSASNLPSAPLITYFINGLEYDQRRTQEPYFVERQDVRQRNYDSTTAEYGQEQGQAFTVEKLMPVPYTLRLQVDFWTTNYQQKLELIEQLGTLFNPSLEIQSTDNFVDWTSLTVVYQDGLTFSSRTIPQGTGNPIDVMSWKFYLPMWLTTSSKLKKYGVINKVIASIFDGKTLEDLEDDDLLMGTRQKISPYGYQVLFIGNSLQLLPQNIGEQPSNLTLETPVNPDTDLYWTSILNMYGAYTAGISQITLDNPYMDTEIVGTIVVDPLDDRYLIFNVDADTLPQNTLDPVTSVINPQITGPNAGLPGPIPNVRYLLVGDIASDTASWGTIIGSQTGKSILPESQLATTMVPNVKYQIASVGTTDFRNYGAPDNNIGTQFTMNNVQPVGSGTVYAVVEAGANDILQFNADIMTWFIAFDASANLTGLEYVTNLTTEIQYRWAETPADSVQPGLPAQWMKSYEGYYNEGDYSIVI
tara:strand:- start:176 stop:1771 length:1596 start_codon:yes stop_codon:yes gene_type:complete